MEPEAWVTHGESTYSHRGNHCYPNAPITDMAGLDDFAGVILYKMNDTWGRNFDQIANFIEEYL